MSSKPRGKPNTRYTQVGKYQILSHVATGGMGAVYRALNTETNEEVALKVLSPELAARPNLVERFRREARSASKLRHKNIITVRECGEANGTHFLAMEFIDGKDLSDYLRDKGQIDVRLAWILMRQAAKALCHAHELGIVHRDIKPSNFLLTKKDKRPQLKLADMGLAREVNEEEFRVTTDGTTVGTVDYMSPEQAKDSASADARSDIYSLGCTFFHLLAGKPPFEGSLAERILKHLNDPPPDLTQFNPNVPYEMKAIVEKMLAKNPDDRYQTARELLKVLNDPPPGLLGGDSSQELPEAKDVVLPNLDGLQIADSDSMPEAQQSPGSDVLRDETEIVSTNTPFSIPIDKASTTAPKPTDTPMPRRKVAPKKRLKLADSSAEMPKAPTKSASKQPTLKVKKRDAVDQEEEDEAGKNYWPWIGVGVALAVIVFVAIFAVSLLGDTDVDPEPDPNGATPIATPTPPKNVVPKPPVPIPVPPNEVIPEPPAAILTAIVKSPKPADELRTTYEGPHQQTLDKFANAKIYRVSRTPLQDEFAVNVPTFSSLAEAIAKLPEGEPSIVELHESVPLHELTIPVCKNRDLLIRPGKDSRPLIVWEIAETEKNPPPWPTHLLAVQNGSLRIENVNFVAHWEDSELLKDSDFFAVENGSLSLIGCSVSTTGHHPKHFRLCRFSSTGRAHQHLIDRCYLRGEDCSILYLEGVGTDLLVRDSLLVNGGENPLIVGKMGTRPATLRVLRSTLVSSHGLLSVSPLLKPDDDMNLQVRACDSILAFHGPEPTQALLDLQGMSFVQFKWSAYNCLYSGWGELLHSPGKHIPSQNLSEWRAQWWQDPVDHLVTAPWPAKLTSSYHHLSPDLFRVIDTPADFSAVTGDGKIGCPLDGLVVPDLSMLADSP